MWVVLRKTDRRGRAGVPETRVRTLAFGLSRAATFRATAMIPFPLYLAPVLPTFRRIRSLAYLTPFAL